jgi:hypothetical protein
VRAGQNSICRGTIWKDYRSQLDGCKIHSTRCYGKVMSIYKTRWFDRWARKQGLNNLSLCLAVREMIEGLYEADLGGGLVKKRVARTGQGKSGGFRTLVATNKGDRWIFVLVLLRAIAAISINRKRKL